MANPAMVKGGPSLNPHGRPPGPTAPTLFLKEAFLRAARTAGGGGEDGLHDYLVKVALSHPQVFVPALSKIIPLQVEAKGGGNITIVIQRSEDVPVPQQDLKLINGHANGHRNGSSNGSHDPSAE
jgi:hypothetical protein